MSTDPNINKTLGNRIKTIRIKQKLTRESLAEKIDVSSRFLADVEAGKTGVSLATLKNICETLNVSSDYLLGLLPDDDEKNFSNLEVLINRIDKEKMQYLIEIVSSFHSATKKHFKSE